MLKRIYLVMSAILNAIVIVGLMAVVWVTAPPPFEPAIALLALSPVFAVMVLQAVQHHYVEAYGRRLISWFPFGDYGGAPFALKFLALLIQWVVVGYFIYLWALWRLGY